MGFWGKLAPKHVLTACRVGNLLGGSSLSQTLHLVRDQFLGQARSNSARHLTTGSHLFCGLAPPPFSCASQRAGEFPFTEELEEALPFPLSTHTFTDSSAD